MASGPCKSMSRKIFSCHTVRAAGLHGIIICLGIRQPPTAKAWEKAVQVQLILGDPGAVSGGRESLIGRKKKIRAKKSQERDFLTFLRPNFFLARLDFLCPH